MSGLSYLFTDLCHLLYSLPFFHNINLLTKNNTASGQHVTLLANTYTPLVMWSLPVLLLVVIFGVVYLIRNPHLMKNPGLILRTSAESSQTEELRKTNHDLLTINSELKKFIYHTALKQKSSISSLKTLLQLAKMDDPDDNMLLYLEGLQRNVLALQLINNGAIDLAVNFKNDIKICFAQLDQIINDAYQQSQGLVNFEKVSLKKEYYSDFTIKTDPESLTAILSQLISNSIKFHNCAQEESHVTVRAILNEGNPMLEIQDNGPGIPPQFQDKIFDMFFRVDETLEGAGLGLYIARELAGKINATLDVASEPGKGTTFRLRL